MICFSLLSREMSISFIVGTERFLLTPEEYSKSALLKELVDLDPTVREVEVQCTCEEFTIVYNFLKFEKIPSMTEFSLIEYFGLSFRDSYGLSCLLEDDMRENMYSDVDTGRDYFDPYYGLYLIDEYFWTELQCKRTYTPDLLFADAPPPVKASWRETQERLEELRPYLLPGVVIAGGAVFSILFDQEIKDIDLFIYGKTASEAEHIIRQITANLERENPSIEGKPWLKTEVARSRNAVTFYPPGKPEVQVILRLYQTPSEIPSGFDVDVCGLGWDGKTLFGTYRAVYALKNLTNTVNFGRLSPSYERRLAKYASRGIAVRVPDFDRSLVNEEMLEADLFRVYPTQPDQSNIYFNMKKIHQLQGLSVLLLLERFAQKIDYRKRLRYLTSRLSSEVSDYSFVPLCSREGETLQNFLIYLHTKNMDPKYFNFSDRYMPLFRELEKQGIKVSGEDWDNNTPPNYVGSSLYPTHNQEDLKKCFHFRIAHPLLSKSCYFVRSGVKDIGLLLHFPKIYYDIISVVRPVDFPLNLEWKTTQPGEQMTNTFHRIVLKDNREWYRGPYYANSTKPTLEDIAGFVLGWNEQPENFSFKGRCVIKHRSQLYFGAEGQLFKIPRVLKSLDVYDHFTPSELHNIIGNYELELYPGQYTLNQYSVIFKGFEILSKDDYRYTTAIGGGGIRVIF